MQPFPHGQGYLTTRLSRNNRKTAILVHRLVALAFLGKPPTRKHVVDHKNGKKTDNRATNLEWVTQAENRRRAYFLGLQQPARIEDVTASRLRHVLRLRRQGLGFARIAQRSAISIRTIRAIVTVFEDEMRAALQGA